MGTVEYLWGCTKLHFIVLSDEFRHSLSGCGRNFIMLAIVAITNSQQVCFRPFLNIKLKVGFNDYIVITALTE